MLITRENALAWWNTINNEAKKKFKNEAGILNRGYLSLTGSDIEYVYDFKWNQNKTKGCITCLYSDNLNKCDNEKNGFCTSTNLLFWEPKLQKPSIKESKINNNSPLEDQLKEAFNAGYQLRRDHESFGLTIGRNYFEEWLVRFKKQL